MATLAEQIELYLRELLSLSSEATVEIRRVDLAESFSCAPSQINYVLATRFTPDRGYVVETRRGGGGYLRISRLAIERNNLLKEMQDCCSDSTLEGFISRLYDEGLLTKRELILFNEMFRFSENLQVNDKESLASHILRGITMLLREG